LPSTFNLQDNIIDVWLCQLNAIQDKNSQFLAQLSMEEKTRAERFKFDIHRNRFIASHGFVRLVLAKYLNIDANEIEYIKGEKGKPYLSDSLDCNNNGLQFNLSHTQDIAILAVTKNSEVGIDIEHNDRKTDWKGICKRFFTMPEQDALFSLDKEQQEIAFFDLWTRKEAYMKVLGTGLSLSPTEFTLTVFPEKPALIQHHSTKFTSLEHVEFISIDLPESLDAYSVTLAVASTLSSKKASCHLYQFT
jgi:4'-phosphopantetheinyl transferase